MTFSWKKYYDGLTDKKTQCFQLEKAHLLKQGSTCGSERGSHCKGFGKCWFFFPLSLGVTRWPPCIHDSSNLCCVCQEQAESCKNVKCHSFVLAVLLQVFICCSSSSSFSAFPCSGFLFLHSFLLWPSPPPLLGMQASIISGSSCYFCTSTKTQYVWTQWTRAVGHNHRCCCWWPVSCCLFKVLICLLFLCELNFLHHFSCWCLFWSRLEI